MEEVAIEKSISQIYNESMKAVSTALLDKNQDTTEVRILIEDLINKVSLKYDLTKEIHSFENPIENILYLSQLKTNNSYNILDIPVHYIYFFLGLTYLDDGIYEDALLNFERCSKINPFFCRAIFKIAECYLNNNDLDKMYNILLDNHKYIYQASDLSDFYSRLGDYYYNIKNYGFANYLYSYSEHYKSTGYNQRQLTNIARFEGRIVKIDEITEVIPVLKEKSIPTSITEEMLQNLIKIYQQPVTDSSKIYIKSLTKNILYDLTKNEVFAPASYLRNDVVGFIFQIPENWEVISRVNYNKSSTSENTLFVIKPLSRVTINISRICKVENGLLKQKYIEIRDNYIKNGSFVVAESLMKSGKVSYIQAFFQKRILNDSVIDVHNYVIINDYLLDFTIPINNNKLIKDELFNDKNVIRINNLLSTLQIIETKKEETEEFTF